MTLYILGYDTDPGYLGLDLNFDIENLFKY